MAEAPCIYIGDGLWDARACRSLEIPFIGIGRAGAVEKLTAAGAVQVFTDYSDPRGFMEVIDSNTKGTGRHEA